MAAPPVGQSLADLLDALTRLDHPGVAQRVEELDAFRRGMAAASLSRTESAALLERVTRAKELAAAADRLYAGWRRLATPAGAAYTAEGCAPPEAQASNLRMDG